ncbi:hypothetical protein VTO73DRAFT_4265 [Trametes versicolor]
MTSGATPFVHWATPQVDALKSRSKSKPKAKPATPYDRYTSQFATSKAKPSRASKANLHSPPELSALGSQKSAETSPSLHICPIPTHARSPSRRRHLGGSSSGANDPLATPLENTLGSTQSDFHGSPVSMDYIPTSPTYTAAPVNYYPSTPTAYFPFTRATAYSEPCTPAVTRPEQHGSPLFPIPVPSSSNIPKQTHARKRRQDENEPPATPPVHAHVPKKRKYRTGQDKLSMCIVTSGTEVPSVITKRLVKEAEQAIKPQNGLHASRKKKKDDSPDACTKLVWADIGAATVSRTAGLISRFQPLLQALLLAVAERPNQADVARRNRPAGIVVTNVISSLSFSRSNRANLLPLARALLHFALSAPCDIFHYNSRIGFMPAYTTVYHVLEELAQQEAETVRAHGKNSAASGCIWFDNVQNYLLQRDARIGRVNALRIGIAATYVETPDAPLTAFDFDDKQRRLAANERASLTVRQLIGFVDQRHRETVGVLHWLRILVNHIPELARYKESVSLWFRTRAAKQRLPEKPAPVHPLATSGKNETITTELKDGLVDFLEQCGQEPADYHRRLILCGGDGLTFEKMVQLKNYLRFHSDPFESLAIVQPVLAPWHTGWTDTSRIIESHWGAYLSPDPSTLGHNAAKIGRRAFSNLRKVDFDSGSELVRLCFEARVLDCWRLYYKADDIFVHFSDLAKREALPEVEDLEAIAKKLHRAYGSQHAVERALDTVADVTRDSDHPKTSAWKSVVPLGSDWTPISASPTTTVPSASPAQADLNGAKTASAGASTSGTKKKPRKAAQGVKDKPFEGDRVLANTISFMGDACVLEEFHYATAEGDVGRVYEAMKMMLFTFAGSPHSKYTSYLLEFISSIELESSPELRESTLASMLINLSGDPGRFAAADLIQEYFNRLLQAIAERKGAEYHDRFLRSVVSRNLHHLARLCDELKKGIGLQSRSGHHSAPQLRSELDRLLEEYQRSELHSRRPGRTYATGADNLRPTDYQRGLANLHGGKLARWVRETSFMRGSHVPSSSPGSHASPNTGDTDLGDSSDTGDSDFTEHPADYSGPEAGSTSGASSAFGTLTTSHLADGILVSDRLDPLSDAARIIQDMQTSDTEAPDEAEEEDEADSNAHEGDSESEYCF